MKPGYTSHSRGFRIVFTYQTPSGPVSQCTRVVWKDNPTKADLAAMRKHAKQQAEIERTSGKGAFLSKSYLRWHRANHPWIGKTYTVAVLPWDRTLHG